MDVIPGDLNKLLPKPIDVNLYSDMSPKQASLVWLNNSLTKKWLPAGSNHAPDKASLDLFLESNLACSTFELNKDSYYYDILVSARNMLQCMLFDAELQSSSICLNKAVQFLRPGPGTSLGTKFTDFIGKTFFSKLTTYDEMHWRFYKQTLSPRWLIAENIRESTYGGCDVVTSSRLAFVPKRSSISRVINTEASLNMMFQLGVGKLIEDVLDREFNISLSKQPLINRGLARLGSIDGSFATIDLKSASDLISDELVKFLLPAPVYQTLNGLRAKRVQLPKRYGGEEVDLHMFSTMGNGFTFPLQTLIFSVLVKATYESMGLPTNCHAFPHFSVFGDDIICVKTAYHKVTEVLRAAGFRVNYDKSFNSGCFRESCGADFFKGHDIRGVYLKEVKREEHVYSAFNRLARWSVRHGIDLHCVLLHLKGLAAFRPVPFDEQDNSGFKVPSDLLTSPKVTKYGSIRYTGLTPVKVTLKAERFCSNPSAQILGALGGYLRNGIVNLRSTQTHYVLKRHTTPSWDWIPQKGLTIPAYILSLSGII